MVFSSSATVYGQPDEVPCLEDFELKAMNPYGRTKVCPLINKWFCFILDTSCNLPVGAYRNCNLSLFLVVTLSSCFN